MVLNASGASVAMESFKTCPDPGLSPSPSKSESLGCQVIAQLVQVMDPLLWLVVRPCSQAGRSEMGEKVEQNQLYQPELLEF